MGTQISARDTLAVPALGQVVQGISAQAKPASTLEACGPASWPTRARTGRGGGAQVPAATVVVAMERALAEHVLAPAPPAMVQEAEGKTRSTQ